MKKRAITRAIVDQPDVRVFDEDFPEGFDTKKEEMMEGIFGKPPQETVTVPARDLSGRKQ